MLEVDYKKMLEQDQDLQDYVADVMLGMILNKNDSLPLIKFINGLYQSGLSKDDAIKTLRITTE